jgi:hypothetical protein
MKTRRRTARKKPNIPIQVIDCNSSSQLGMVVNLTHEGLLLVSQEPIPTHQIYELELLLETGVNTPSNIFIGAETVWSDQSGMHTNYYWTGFSIIDISDETISRLKQLTASWEPDED